jgi:hypothetical protein
MAEIKSLAIAGYPVAYTAKILQVSCIQAPLPWGTTATSEEVELIHPNAGEFWSVWGDIINSILDLSPATPTGYE